MATRGYIQARLAEIQAQVIEKYEVTAESMARQFDDDRKLAIECKQMGAAVAAGVAKSKLFGLTTEKQTIAVTHSYGMMTEDELRYEIAALNAEARSIKPGIKH